MLAIESITEIFADFLGPGGIDQILFQLNTAHADRPTNNCRGNQKHEGLRAC